MSTNNQGHTFIVCHNVENYGKYSDHYTVFRNVEFDEGRKEAKQHYDKVIQEERVISASICLVIESTDYEHSIYKSIDNSPANRISLACYDSRENNTKPLFFVDANKEAIISDIQAELIRQLSTYAENITDLTNEQDDQNYFSMSVEGFMHPAKTYDFIPVLGLSTNKPTKLVIYKEGNRDEVTDYIDISNWTETKNYDNIITLIKHHICKDHDVHYYSIKSCRLTGSGIYTLTYTKPKINGVIYSYEIEVV